MTKLPVKVLLDENKKPFVPYMNTDTVFYGDTDKTVSETLDEAVAEVSDLANAVDELAKEVAAKIETVFTYKGNVTNYNALQQIVAPNVGDVYNTLDTDKNYAWSGTKWDDLGGIVDLSDYCTEDRMLYIIEEHSKVLGNMLTNQMNNALLEYYTKDETEKLVDDALSNAEVSVDLSDYYTKEEVDVRIPNINTTTLLKSAGHVDTVEELPSTSQPSGNVGEHPSVLNTDLTTTDVSVNISELPNLTTLNGVHTPYVFGFYADNENYFFVSTTNPELIDGFSYSLDGSFNIHVNEGTNPESNFWVAHACYNGLFMPGLPPSDPDGCALLLPHFPGAVEAFNEGQRDMLMPPTPIMGTMAPGILMLYLGDKGPVRIFGNLPKTIKYRPHVYRAFKKLDGMGNIPEGWEELEDAERDSLTLSFANNYTYTDGMEALRFDEDYNAYWITDADGAKENDVATVGDNNDIYVNEPNKGWTPWAKPKDIDTSVFLKQTGHVDSIDSLPSVGQPSGSVIDNYFADANDRLDLTGAILPDMQGYQYCFGFVDNSGSSNYCYVLTNYPEIIKSVGIAKSYNYQVITIDATPEKPAVLYNKYGSFTGPIYRIVQSDGSYNYNPYGANNGYSTTNKTLLYGAVTNYRMFGVLGNHVIKYANYAETGYYRKQQDNSGYPAGDYYNQSMVSKSYSNTPRNEGYIYNADMFFIKDAEDMNVAFVTSEAVAKVNDICTVGENNNIYLCVEGPRWLPLALPHDVYTKAEIDAMLGEIESVLDNILNGG